MDKYVVYTKFDGAWDVRTMTIHDLATLWNFDQEVGLYECIKAAKCEEGFPEVDVDEVVSEYMKEQKEIQEEYETYTEAVAEYGYDEVNYNPYIGGYDFEEDDDYEDYDYDI